AIFGLERFNQTCSGTCTYAGGTCNATAASGQVLGGIVDGNQNSLIPWVDNTCNACTMGGANNTELRAAGNTPLEGSLRAAQAYYQDPVNSPMVGDMFAS